MQKVEGSSPFIRFIRFAKPAGNGGFLFGRDQGEGELCHRFCHRARALNVSTATPALLAAAAGVGFGHAILPDHWVPLAVVGRTRRYPLARVARLSGMAGVAHVLVSIVLGGVIIAVGLQFRSTVQSAQDAIIGCVLILTGLGFAILELTGHGHRHDHSHTRDHGHTHQHDHSHAHEQPHLLSVTEVDERVAAK